VILYLDSSSAVKLYVEEEDSAHVERMVEAADRVSSSRIAYAEIRAAFAAAWRAGRIAGQPYRGLVQAFDRDWRRYVRVSPSEAVIRLAGNLAEKHGLRGYDAVHLASALSLKNLTREDVSFSSRDRDLSNAASAEGLALV
jgi:predicted nucleic acid-binding protein